MADGWEKPAVGGHVSLDFVNTVAWRFGPEYREDLCTYPDWIRWARHFGLLTQADARNALRWADKHPAKADAIHARVVQLREAIHGILRAHVDRTPIPQPNLALINEALVEAFAAMKLRPHESGFLLDCERQDDSSHALWSLIRSTASLVASPDLDLLRVCAGPECGWFFLDRSRNGRRRWCIMSDCGNREKARRFYRRHKSD